MEYKKEIQEYIKDNAIDVNKIIDDYTPYVRTVIQNMVQNNLSEEDKEEIIVDTFFVLWKKYNENVNIYSLSSYIAGITRNLIQEKLKKAEKNEVDINEYENILKEEDIYTKEREEINEIYKEIESLGTIDITIMKMFYYQNKSIKDIAKELKITETNAKTRLHRIRKKIRKKVK